MQDFAEPSVAAVQQIAAHDRVGAGDAHGVILRPGLAEGDEHLADRARREAQRRDTQIRLGIRGKRAVARRGEHLDDLLARKPAQQIDEVAAGVHERRRVVGRPPPVVRECARRRPLGS